MSVPIPAAPRPISVASIGSTGTTCDTPMLSITCDPTSTLTFRLRVGLCQKESPPVAVLPPLLLLLLLGVLLLPAVPVTLRGALVEQCRAAGA